MGFVATITMSRTYVQKVYHYLFECPTFWRVKPAFKCPICGETYRCYWDGNDVDGLGINICTPCTEAHAKVLKHSAMLAAREGK